MAVQPFALGRAALVAAALTVSTSLLSAQCGIDPNMGPALGLGDDQCSPAQPLGFSFPFAGVNYDSVVVSSNGFVYLWDSVGAIPLPTNSLCCTGNTGGLLNSASPMVCGVWMDLYPPGGGSVNYNALPGRVLITWNTVPEYGSGGTNTFQIALYPTGVIEMAFGADILTRSHTALTGWSPGAGAADPGGSDFSALPLFPASATVYELFGPGTFDLQNLGFQATPTGPAGWLVAPSVGCARARTYGRGCRNGCDLYEEFPSRAFDLSGGSLYFTSTGAGSYFVTNCAVNCFDQNFVGALALTDDSLAVGMQLGFTFPYCGGTTNAVDVCSNGYLWLQSGSSGLADFTATVPEFLAQPARLAPFWHDLNPSSGGTVYFDALPGKAMVTWNQVPTFGTGTPVTIQLQLFSNGDIVIAWPSAINDASTGAAVAIVGITAGNGATDPGATDISAVPFSTGAFGAIPARLAPQAGSRPVIGQNFLMDVSNVTAGTITGAMNMGFANPNLNLGVVGLPDCTLLSSIDLSIGLVPVSPVTTFTFGIPNIPALVGGILNSQAVMIDPALSGIPAYLSNGVEMTFGN